MKRLSSQQIQNILFTCVVMLAALAVYLLAGQGELATTEAATAPAQETPEQRLGFEAVPGVIFLALMTTNDDFLARADGEDPTLLRMQCGGAKTGRASLQYTLDENERVSSFTLLLPMQKKPVSKPKSAEELAYVTSYEAFIAEQNIAVEKMLLAAVSACDLNGVLIHPVALRWYSGALSARDSEKRFEDVYQNCAFQAYPLQLGAQRTLVCSLIVDG